MTCFSILCLFTLLTACRSGNSEQEIKNDRVSEIPVCVDPRIELFSTIHRLAGTGQYDSRDIPVYIRDVEEHFGPFRDHEAVRLAIKLRETHGLDGNSPMALAVYLTDPPALEGLASLDPVPSDLDPRWTSDAIRSFLQAARKFAIDTDFGSFFTGHQSVYDHAINNLHGSMKGSDLLPWFQEYFGYKPDDYVIIIGMQNGTCNYGSRITMENGRREFQSVLGASQPDLNGAPQYPRNWFIPVIVHEFCHSYINPMIDRNTEMLREAGEIIFPYHKEKLQLSGYNYWYVMMYEYMTRACVIRYLFSREGAKAAGNQMAYDERNGFTGIRGLVKILGEYETQRARYPDMEAFMPLVVTYFKNYAVSFN